MLPPVSCAFKIPNINDGVELDCRIYFPRPAQRTNETLVSGFAIFAHPYAPLGGCYDDPIVQSVGNVLLEKGIVLCTFNFRGARGSPGGTSWTGKPELSDYVSVYTFMLHLIEYPEMLGYVMQNWQQPILILGGYSYGSLIASHLPDYEAVKMLYSIVQEGSSDFEIRQRAHEVVKVLLSFLEAHAQRGRDSIQSEDHPGSPSSKRGIMIGGYESEEVNRRVRRNSSRRSIEMDKIRHSIEKVKHRLSHKSIDISKDGHDSHANLVDHSPPAVMPKIAYLLVSPLLQPVSGLTTIFSRLNFESKSSVGTPKPVKSVAENLTENATLAMYGNKDIFTLSSKLRKWSQELQDMPGSCFQSREITGAGHFWHEMEAHDALCMTIRTWVIALVDGNKQKKPSKQISPDIEASDSQ